MPVTVRVDTAVHVHPACLAAGEGGPMDQDAVEKMDAMAITVAPVSINGIAGMLVGKGVATALNVVQACHVVAEDIMIPSSAATEEKVARIITAVYLLGGAPRRIF